MDQDGDLDVVVSSENGIFLFSAPAWEVHSVTGTTGEFEATLIDVADIDSDGDTDVAYSNEDINTVLWYENPSWAQHVIDADLAGATGVILRDVDKDGHVDVIASGQASDQVVWYKSPYWGKHIIDSTLAGASWLGPADMNGDGRVTFAGVGAEDGIVVLYTTDPTGIPANPRDAEIPGSAELHQNYPNPFNPSTTIKYKLPTSSLARLSVYDILGREVSVLVNERRDAGTHDVKFDAGRLSSGVYFYRLQAGDFTQTKRLLLLR
jgi:hypothetical protein